MASTTSSVCCSLMNIHKLACERFNSFSTTSVTITTTAATATASCKLSLTKSMADRRFLISSGNGASARSNITKFVAYSGDQVAADLLPLGFHLPDNWPVWLPGVLMALVVPFFTNKLGPFGKFKDKHTIEAELDKLEEVVDNVADRVEEIAEKAEEFIGDIADDLPEGSQLKQKLHKVEMVVDTIGKDAKFVSDMVDKMDEIEAKLETMLDKVANKNTTPPPEV